MNPLQGITVGIAMFLFLGSHLTGSGTTIPAAAGQPLKDVFRIVDEQSGASVDNPAEAVFRTETMIPLPDHSRLQRRDGEIISIDGRRTPVRNENGQVLGTVIVFQENRKTNQ